MPDGFDFHIHTGSSEPIYRQLVEHVRRRVAAGQIKAGDEIPSVRDLAQQLAVHPMTISKAYSLLEAEGLLERRRGLAMRVAPQHQRAQPAASRIELLRPGAANALRPRPGSFSCRQQRGPEAFRRTSSNEDDHGDEHNRLHGKHHPQRGTGGRSAWPTAKAHRRAARGCIGSCCQARWWACSGRNGAGKTSAARSPAGPARRHRPAA